MKNKETTPINLISKIKNLKLLDCNITKTIPSTLIDKFNKDKVQFEFNIGIRVDNVSKTITVTLNTRLFADEAKIILLGFIKTEGEFEILNLEEILTVFNNQIPQMILANFTGVVIGTSRGFLINEAKDTLMDGVFIPMINPLSLFPQSNETKK